jgi:hypothetical protein
VSSRLVIVIWTRQRPNTLRSAMASSGASRWSLMSSGGLSLELRAHRQAPPAIRIRQSRRNTIYALNSAPLNASRPGASAYSASFAWNKTITAETSASCAPSLWRSAAGVWGPWSSTACQNVILYPGLPDYSSYVSEFKLAPNVGFIQQGFLYTEDGAYLGNRNCGIGVPFEPDHHKTSNGVWHVDERT